MLQINHRGTAYQRPVYVAPQPADLFRYAAVLARALPIVELDLTGDKPEDDPAARPSVESFILENEGVRHRLLEKKYSEHGLNFREQMTLDLINEELERLIDPPLSPGAAERQALAEAKRLIAEARRGSSSSY
jgi:hypothetical protein